MIDVESGMNHFDAAVEPHLRYNEDAAPRNPRVLSRARLDHMEQLPEELRSIQRHACPSSSQDDVESYLWQRCPDKKQLSSDRQQNIPSFTNSTVQYIIDSNISASSASEETTDNVVDDDVSSTGSPSTKRPRLDVTESASPRSAVSETPNQPVQTAAAESSYPDDDGPLSNSQLPATLSSYPVYKPNIIHFRGSAKCVDRPRPLSYRWLIGHCAEHIHVHRGIVERYVERLELLHVVPRNVHNASERLMRIGLTRRLFRPTPTDSDKPKVYRYKRLKKPPRLLL